MPNDPFAVLGLTSSATEDEIKSAYRKLAKKYHPDLNPGDKVAEEKMREVNDAYTRALQIKKGKPDPAWQDSRASSGGYGNPFGGYGNPFGGGYGYGSSGQSRSDNRQGSYGQGNPFEDFGFGFGFNPFYGASGGQQTRFRTRTYASPELQTVQEHILATRYNEAISLLNRIPNHNADWHALYARADLGLGNRISALDHARAAARLSPQDADYQNLLSIIESGRQTYQQTRNSGYDFRSLICSNPCLTCCAANMLLNCCLGGCGRYGMFC